MAKKKRLVIPVFIPFGGCPHRCVFCNQNNITGAAGLPATGDVVSTVKRYLSTWKGSGRREIAFYGGSFTALEREIQQRYLETACSFVADGSVDSVRISTRPDYIDDGITRFLKRYAVETVELGAQSFSDEVLRLSARGHDSRDTERAVGTLQRGGIEVGVQLMPGLPGDTEESIIESARKAASLRPSFVRIYPTLVIKDTPLYRMYLEGSYTPWSLAEMVRVLRVVYGIFTDAGIPVVRVGLHSSSTLEEGLVDGPFHPSLRELILRPEEAAIRS